MNHTPGPWEIIDGFYPCFKEVKGPSFKLSVCIQATDITFEDAMQRESDMELIAAAPELLKALKAVAALEVEPGEILTGRELTNAVAAAKASISKATGVTP
jgi:hypothetical protein